MVRKCQTVRAGIAANIKYDTAPLGWYKRQERVQELFFVGPDRYIRRSTNDERLPANRPVAFRTTKDPLSDVGARRAATRSHPRVFLRARNERTKRACSNDGWTSLGAASELIVLLAFH